MFFAFLNYIQTQLWMEHIDTRLKCFEPVFVPALLDPNSSLNLWWWYTWTFMHLEYKHHDLSELWAVSCDPSCSCGREAIILLYGALFSLLKDHHVCGATIEAGTFYAVQALSDGFVHCNPCLSYLVTAHCGSKFWNYDTLFKIQEKWWNVNVMYHQTMEECKISTK